MNRPRLPHTPPVPTSQRLARAQPPHRAAPALPSPRRPPPRSRMPGRRPCATSAPIAMTRPTPWQHPTATPLSRPTAVTRHCRPTLPQCQPQCQPQRLRLPAPTPCTWLPPQPPRSKARSLPRGPRHCPGQPRTAPRDRAACRRRPSRLRTRRPASTQAATPRQRRRAAPHCPRHALRDPTPQAPGPPCRRHLAAPSPDCSGSNCRADPAAYRQAPRSPSRRRVGQGAARPGRPRAPPPCSAPLGMPAPPPSPSTGAIRDRDPISIRPRRLSAGIS